MHSTSTTDVDPVGTAGRLLRTAGVFVMPSADVNRCLRADAQVWSPFSAHWDDLVRDRYAAELGTPRLRRYGWFSLRRSDGVVSAMPHHAFVQPQDSNPLYIDTDRNFEPLTAASRPIHCCIAC